MSAEYPDIAPEKIDDKSQDVSGMSDGVIVVCRGERKLQHVVYWHGKGKVYEEIVDLRMNAPVAVCRGLQREEDPELPLRGGEDRGLAVERLRAVGRGVRAGS